MPSIISQESKRSLFEEYPYKTATAIVLVLLLVLYGLISIKWINNRYTEGETKSIKTVLHQYYVGKIIDNNIGRFIKLREHRPQTVRWERPSRNYISHIAPNTVKRQYYKIATDQHGFLLPSDIHSNPDIKIVFLGGSTTECLYMQETERFPYLVGRSLEARLGKKVNSYNGGVSANESMHSLNILLNKVLPLQPHVVVLMHNINDLVILRSQGGYGYTGSLKSHVQTSKNVFTRYEFPPTQVSFDPDIITREFIRNLRTFISICRIRDIEPVLMTQANRVQNDDLYHRFNDVIREVGAREGVVVIDLAAAIPPTSDYLYDSYHYTAQGAAQAAQVITEALYRAYSQSR